VQPVVTYIYLCGRCYVSCLLFSSNLPSLREHILNGTVRQAWKNLYTIGILSYTDSCCLVPFSSNISCICPQRESLFLLDSNGTVSYISHQWGTQQENFAAKHTVIYMFLWLQRLAEWMMLHSPVTTNCVTLLILREERKTSVHGNKRNIWGFEDYRQAAKLLWGAYVHNWIEWLGCESDHKPLSNVELTSGAIFLCLYKSVWSI
jgi:hypothetical protein